jgi:hypothetical protein
MLGRAELKKMINEMISNHSVNLWEYSLNEVKDLEESETEWPTGQLEDGEGRLTEEDAEELEETSTMGGGAVAGAPGGAWGEPNEHDVWLREAIRSMIFEVIKENVSEYTIQENKLRSVIRDILLEKKSTTTLNPHQLTGINSLETVLKNTMATMEADYKTLTTSQEQRDSYRAQIQHSFDNLFTRVLTNKDADENPDIDGQLEESEEELQETGTSIRIVDEDNPFIDIDGDGQPDREEDPQQGEPPVEEPMQGIDATGRGKALKTVTKISPQVESALSELSDPVDLEAFVKYFKINLNLYLDKYNDELVQNLDQIEAEPEPDDVVDTEDGLGGDELNPDAAPEDEVGMPPEDDPMMPDDLEEEWKKALRTKLEFMV